MEKYLKKLKELKNNSSSELALMTADDILCEILKKLGYNEIVKAYEDVKKKYA